MATNAQAVANGAQDVRPMSMHERYSLMRQNAGHPHVILHVVVYPSASMPSTDALERRVAELQAALPMLSARVVGAHSTKPAYVPGVAWPAPAIVHEGVPASCSVAAYKTAMDEFTTKSVASASTGPEAPMWRIRMFPPGSNGEGYLTLALNHLLIDGRGSTLLLAALTADLGSPSPLQPEPWTAPTTFDATIPTTPSLRFLLPIVFRELLLPKLPRFVQEPFLASDPWPGVRPGDPLTCAWDIHMLSLDPSLISRVKKAGAARGVSTLHPLLKMAYCAAMWRVFNASAPLHIAVETARSERKAALGHAAITHNYVSATMWDATLAGDDMVWARTKELAQAVGPAGVLPGRMTLGLLRHIPDPEVDESAAGFDPKRPTGWEKYFVERAQSGRPFRDSMAMSNLGRIELPPGASDAWWGQTATPFGSAIMVNVVGHEGGVRISSAFRLVVTTTESVGGVHATVRRVLERMGSSSEGEDITLEDITASGDNKG
ncbi:hypothetical protein CC85DRAFT_264474 [Cutaneotrichosporon oleaginosum]|uniref:Diacylglycerol O-acyltransferase n=1 Tax=Cutaneotrichosporon oleaginosum TaxID=879819 RepID=A0A0J1AXD1_9TREE|nr:uncharacterized protein CC85DRAFT_264474 [Cutaneotrichosporon oleaginosum]KLT39964.1 hypothetical protein CC85DRAFT_264474 [Cutaneotrichosporon oleaginosum]TXT14153.1 hypothetical protein COLE_00346 [Cutaneotrichosporon oleaginosum]